MTGRDQLGREPVTVVEVDQDQCPLLYGATNVAGTCPAVLGVDSASKCYNTLATCPVQDSFIQSVLTLRFCTPVQDTGLGKGITVIPSVTDVVSVPTEINVGGSDRSMGRLGRRAVVTTRLRDHPYHDGLVDKYAAERDFDPMVRGTFWSKWLARNPYHLGRAIRIKEGYVGQALSEFRVRHYVIERIEGPTRGEVKIVAKDILKLLDDVRSQSPRPSTGVIAESILEGSTSMVVVPRGEDEWPDDETLDGEYSTSGILRIGGELVSFTRVAGSNTFTLTARGLRGTSPSDHDEGETVQVVYVADAVRIDELIQDLMVNYGRVPAELLDSAGWASETTLWLTGFNLSVWITQPTGVAQLISELVEQGSCYVWWDDLLQKVKFSAVRPLFPAFDGLPQQIDDEGHIVADSVSIEYKQEERISQVWIYYDQINPTAGENDPANYRRLRVLTDPAAESALQYGDSRIKTIFARFMGVGTDAATLITATRILERYRDAPVVVTWSMDYKDTDLRPGGVLQMLHRDLVDSFGERAPTLLQITSVAEAEIGHRIELKARAYLFRSRYGFIMANDAPGYSAASESERELGGWIAPDAAGFANGDLPYRIL